jgi:hypothetical protein
MSNKPETPEEGTNDPQKQQLVYMMPQHDFDEDEIDLWQLFLPLIKYKVQILLFLIVGLGIGLGYPQYKRSQTRQKTAAVKPNNESIGITLKQLTEELEIGKQDFFSLIDQTPAEGKQLLITGAEYQYTTKENPGKVQIIRLDTFRDLKKKKAATKINNAYDLILTIESRPTMELIKQLKNTYSELFELDRELLILDQKRKIGQINAYTKTHKKEAQSGDITNEKRGSQSNLVGQSRLRQTALQARIQLLHDTLSDPVYFEFRHNKVPWTIWKDIKSQLKEEEEEEEEEEKHQNLIKTGAKTLKSKTAEISKYQMMDYLLTNNLNLPAERFNWPSIAAVQSFRNPPLPTAPINSKKVLLISIAIALFLGIFSVYLRIFAGNLSRGDGFEKQKQELMKAFKHWKL